ncbi:MAG TPA: cytochrome c [Bryobacteraceae bacterium]|nr:cytochrome c [Bryobacteraceae bacterium]
MKHIVLHSLRVLFGFALCVFSLAPLSSAQNTKYPPLRSVDAHAIFRAYCAPCHGVSGRGHGPAASALKTKVADLTMLSKNNGGEFPADRVRAILEGTQSPSAHGSKEMPVWGPVFHQVDADQDLGSVRVQNLVAYIESLQSK